MPRFISIVALLVFVTAPGLLSQDIKERLAAVNAGRIEKDVRSLVSFHNRHTLSRASEDGKRGAPAAARFILRSFEEAASQASIKMVPELHLFDPRGVARAARLLNPDYDGRKLENVICKIPGRDENRVIIVSGHYDSRATRRMDTEGYAPGANDDGSGTAVVMELARVLAGLKEQPRASIWLTAFTGEELGLWGAAALAKECADKGIEVEAMITNDIVGGDKETNAGELAKRLRVFSEGRPVAGNNSPERLRRLSRVASESDSPSRQLARYLRERSQAHLEDFDTQLIFRLDRFLRGGDHRPFTQQGFAAIRLTEFRENFTHQHQDVVERDGVQFGDLPEYLNYDYIAQVTRVNAITLLSLGYAPAPPARVRVDTRRLMNETPPPLAQGRRFGHGLPHPEPSYA